MSDTAPSIDVEAAEECLMSLLMVEGLSGQEAAIAAAVSEALMSLGVPSSAIRFDDANERIDLPTQTGNLIADLPGTLAGPRLMFSTHLDTVQLCAGVKPRRDGDRIVTDGTTALGGDNRTGCAVLITLAKTLLEQGLPHPPITLLFTVREESGIQGAKELNASLLGSPTMCFNVDSKIPADLIIGAVGQESWQVEITGQAAHAGVAPEKGISSTLVAAIAIAQAHREGWFGKVIKPEGTGTSNVGVFGGKHDSPAGQATNVVTDYVLIKGESRSSAANFATSITAAFEKAFQDAARQVTSSDQATAKVKFDSHAAYPPFNIAADSPMVKHALRAAEQLGLPSSTLFSNGGLDANWLVAHGIPTVTFGAGQYEIHTVNEYVNVPEFIDGCRFAIALATQAIDG
jgi:tripeptide aminopeptidase